MSRGTTEEHRSTATSRRFWERAVQFSGDLRSWDELVGDAASGDADSLSTLNTIAAKGAAASNGSYPAITEYDDLVLLPVGSVVIGGGGWWVFQSDYLGAEKPGVTREIEWGSGATWFKTEQIALPARLLHIPLESDGDQEE